MRPLSVVGWLFVLFGAVVLVMRGVSYTKERESVQVGPLEVATERKGFVPPVAGAIALVAGAVLIFTARKRS